MAEKRESRAASHMGGEKKSSHKKSDSKNSKKKSKVHVMHVKHADNGGYIATHDFAPPEGGAGPMPQSEDHIIPDMGGLQAHMADHMSQEPEPEPAPAGGGAPAGGPAAPMPGM